MGGCPCTGRALAEFMAACQVMGEKFAVIIDAYGDGRVSKEEYEKAREADLIGD